jgi:hypothetical protein
MMAPKACACDTQPFPPMHRLSMTICADGRSERLISAPRTKPLRVQFLWPREVARHLRSTTRTRAHSPAAPHAHLPPDRVTHRLRPMRRIGRQCRCRYRLIICLAASPANGERGLEFSGHRHRLHSSTHAHALSTQLHRACDAIYICYSRLGLPGLTTAFSTRISEAPCAPPRLACSPAPHGGSLNPPHSTWMLPMRMEITYLHCPIPHEEPTSHEF